MIAFKNRASAPAEEAVAKSAPRKPARTLRQDLRDYWHQLCGACIGALIAGVVCYGVGKRTSFADGYNAALDQAVATVDAVIAECGREEAANRALEQFEADTRRAGR
jgi:hypothetical protein